MKKLIIIMSLFAINAFAVDPTVIASAERNNGVPGHPATRVEVLSNGLVTVNECPIAPVNCKTTSSKLLSSTVYQEIAYYAGKAANGPEVHPTRPPVECQAIGRVTTQYYARGNNGQLQSVATVNAPCKHHYKNPAAQALVGELDQYIPAGPTE